MIREYLGKKASRAIDNSRFKHNKAARITATILDDEKLDNLGLNALNTIHEELHHPYLRYRMFAIAIAVNALSWLLVLVTPTLISKLVTACALIFPKGPALLLAPATGFTMMGVFSLLRIYFPEQDHGMESNQVMSSYVHETNSSLTWKLWCISCGAAGVNAILIAVTYLAMTGGWDR